MPVNALTTRINKVQSHFTSYFNSYILLQVVFMYKCNLVLLDAYFALLLKFCHFFTQWQRVPTVPLLVRAQQQESVTNCS